jgi:hypothetical protein
MSRYDDDRRYEQRRLDRIADERRYEQRRHDDLADERRREQRRQDYLADERRREQRRRDHVDEENRRRDREDREKSQQETNASAMAWLRAGNAEAAAALWGLNLGGRPAPAAWPGAPTLTVEPGSVPGIAWLQWAGADLLGTWVLQVSDTESFADPVEEYRGGKARHLVLTPDAAPRWYRVRNEGWSGRPGPWSDAVRLDPPPRRLAAPRLEVARDPLTGTTWSWGAVEGAAGYLLERGLGPGFVAPVEVYRGPLTWHIGTPLSPLLAWPPPRSLRAELLGALHRVKALGRGGSLDSPWSNVV